MRSLALSRRPLNSVTTERSVSSSPWVVVSWRFRLCLRWYCCPCGRACAGSCRTERNGLMPLQPHWCSGVWPPLGLLRTCSQASHRYPFSTVICAIGYFGPSSPLPFPFHFSGRSVHQTAMQVMTEPPNHALQRTRRERRGCSRCVPCAGSLSLGR